MLHSGLWVLHEKEKKFQIKLSQFVILRQEEARSRSHFGPGTAGGQEGALWAGKSPGKRQEDPHKLPPQWPRRASFHPGTGSEGRPFSLPPSRAPAPRARAGSRALTQWRVEPRARRARAAGATDRPLGARLRGLRRAACPREEDSCARTGDPPLPEGSGLWSARSLVSSEVHPSLLHSVPCMARGLFLSLGLPSLCGNNLWKHSNGNTFK